jgi:hypothetical protein
MEGSPLGLDIWFAAMWLLANAKNGISSYKLHRALGITQKSAWFVLHRIRLALSAGAFEKKVVGTCEADATHIGGRISNMHKSKKEEKGISGRGMVGKAIVMGIDGYTGTKTGREAEQRSSEGNRRDQTQDIT